MTCDSLVVTDNTSFVAQSDISSSVVNTEETFIIITEDSDSIAQTEELWQLVKSTDVGPKGDKGEQGESRKSYVAAEDISGHKVVIVDATGKIAKANCTVASNALSVVGITTDAVVTGQTTFVSNSGSVEHLGWTFLANLPIYLGTDGALTQTLPVIRAFTKIVAIATSPTVINISIQPAILVN